MKHIITYNNFLLEKRVDVNEYPNKNYLGLVAKDINRFGRTTKFLTLYDFKNYKVIAHIELKNMMDINVFEVNRSFAEKGWGPLIYDFGLMYSFPKPVAPSKIIQPTAINVWKYYYELRSDVTKSPMKIGDELYDDKYKNDEMEDDFKSDDNLLYLNNYYFLKPSEEFKSLVDKGKQFLAQNGIKPSELFKLGYKEFKKKFLSNQEINQEN